MAYSDNPEYYRNYQRVYRQKNREQRRKWNSDWILANRERYNAAKYIYRERTKYEVMTHYAQGDPRCAKCGFKDIDALCLDHINDDGSEHRKQLGATRRSGISTYEVLRKVGYPEGLQVLCANCNLIKEQQRKRAKRLGNPFYADYSGAL